MADAWTVFTSSLTKGWNTAQNFISKGVLRLMKLFDSNLDVEAASKILDEDFQKKNAETDRTAQRMIGERDRVRQDQRTQIEADRQGAQVEVGRMAEADRAARQRQNEADLQGSADALAQARKEWEDALAEAAQKRQDVEAAGGPDRIKKAKDNLTDMDDLLSQMGQEKISVKGTFNALGARGLASEGPAERTAKASEETAKNTKRLLQEAQHGGLTFS
jgi:hypothetical protein